jgi:hypothetical protein
MLRGGSRCAALFRVEQAAESAVVFALEAGFVFVGRQNGIGVVDRRC